MRKLIVLTLTLMCASAFAGEEAKTPAPAPVKLDAECGREAQEKFPPGTLSSKDKSREKFIAACIVGDTAAMEQIRPGLRSRARAH